MSILNVSAKFNLLMLLIYKLTKCSLPSHLTIPKDTNLTLCSSRRGAAAFAGGSWRRATRRPLASRLMARSRFRCQRASSDGTAMPGQPRKRGAVARPRYSGLASCRLVLPISEGTRTCRPLAWRIWRRYVTLLMKLTVEEWFRCSLVKLTRCYCRGLG